MALEPAEHIHELVDVAFFREVEPGADATVSAKTMAVVHYQLDPAKPALWLRLLVGKGS